MAEIKKTQRDMYALIAELLADNVEVVEFCNLKMNQIDNRKNSLHRVPADVQERRDAVVEFLKAQEGPVTVKEIAEALGFSSPKVSGAMRGLVTAGIVETVEPEQKSKAKAYQLVA